MRVIFRWYSDTYFYTIFQLPLPVSKIKSYYQTYFSIFTFFNRFLRLYFHFLNNFLRYVRTHNIMFCRVREVEVESIIGAKIGKVNVTSCDLILWLILVVLIFIYFWRIPHQFQGEYPLQTRGSADGPQIIRSVGIFTIQIVRGPSMNHCIQQFFLIRR